MASPRNVNKNSRATGCEDCCQRLCSVFDTPEAD